MTDFCGIGVKSRFFLAPMAGVTDLAFRSVCAAHGAALTYTEMVSAKALCYNDKKTAEILEISEAHRPCFAQIFGAEPDICADGARRALKISGADGIDINMGCPMPKIVRNGEGSALMADTDRIYDIVSAVCAAVSVPVTVKLRAGIDAEHINAVEAALAAQNAGARAVCIHGRTKEQLYSGTSSRAVIADVKRALSVPVIASGDALCVRDCFDILAETGADFIMIARGARGNPCIFGQCGGCVQDVTAEMLMSALREQAELACAQKGEERAIPELRKHALWYLGRIKGTKALKNQASAIKTKQELFRICAEALETGR